MTREEAIKIFNTVLLFGKCDCPKEEIEECLKIAIKALEQKPILDKIRAEIETEKNAGCHTQYAGGLDFAMSIIDKYKAESEEEE